MMMMMIFYYNVFQLFEKPKRTVRLLGQTWKSKIEAQVNHDSHLKIVYYI